MAHTLEEKLRKQRRKSLNRLFLATLVLTLLTAASYVIMLGQGAVYMSPRDVVDALFGGGTRQQITVVWDFRLPVALATVVVGAALGIAGAWTQIMARNPLASPDILGVTGGASVMVVLGSVTARPGFAEALPQFWFRAGLAMLGAVLVVLLLVLVGGIGTSNKIVVIGFALSLMLQAVVSFLLLKAPTLQAADAQTWLAGSTEFIRMPVLPPLIIGLLPFLLVGLWCARDLPMLAYDETSAATRGVNVALRRAMLLISATGISAVVVSVAGPIGFIALIAPHIARLVARTFTPSPLVSAVAGAALLTACSVVAGALPVTAPVGAVSSAIGGAVLVVLIWRGPRQNL